MRYKPLTTWDETEKPVRTAIDVTAERVEYHRDTVEYLVKNETDRCASEGKPLSKSEVEAFRIQVIKTLVIQNKAEAAVNLKSSKE